MQTLSDENSHQFQNYLSKHSYIQKCIKSLFVFILFYHPIVISQTINVQGTVSANGMPIRYAAVTFIDQSDTTKKFTALTDTTGHYLISAITGITEKPKAQPANIALEQNYPNPFSSSTAISYQLNKQADVNVTIYDILGREVKRFAVSLQTVGVHGVVWDGTNNVGEKVAIGVYFYRLQAKGETQVKKMVFTGGSIPVRISSFKMSSLKNEKVLDKTITSVTTGTYRCQIKNTNETYPRILTKELNELHITKDTSINIIAYADYFPLQIGNEWTFQTTYWDPWIGGDTTVTTSVKITNVKRINGKDYYRFNDRFGFGFFMVDLIVEDFDTVFIRQTEKGDIMLFAADSEWVYFRFDAALLDTFVVAKIVNGEHAFNIASINDTVNTSIGLFENCYKIYTEFPQVADSDYIVWFAPGYGPVKIYYPEFGGTVTLIGIKIQK